MNKRQIINQLRLHKINQFLQHRLLFKKELFYMRKHVLEGIFIMQILQETIPLDNDCLYQISSFLTGHDYLKPKNTIMYH